jgi:hypothetical protein
VAELELEVAERDAGVGGLRLGDHDGGGGWGRELFMAGLHVRGRVGGGKLSATASSFALP